VNFKEETEENFEFVRAFN
jgi:hypothetical protein